MKIVIKSSTTSSKSDVDVPATPNYMNPTTSFEAKVSQRKVLSDSGKNSINGLGKASSSQKKKSSFKTMFKSSLSENLDVKRATCSSTLKDRKFPDFLALNPRGTESEGVSTVKVCPYTYCSLNGDFHASLVSFKCFISAKRHMIKTQNSLSSESIVVDEFGAEEMIEEFPLFGLNSDSECKDAKSNESFIEDHCFVEQMKLNSQVEASFFDEDDNCKVEMPANLIETHLEVDMKTVIEETIEDFRSFELNPEASESSKSKFEPVLRECKDVEEVNNRVLNPDEFFDDALLSKDDGFVGKQTVFACVEDDNQELGSLEQSSMTEIDSCLDEEEFISREPIINSEDESFCIDELVDESTKRDEHFLGSLSRVEVHQEDTKPYSKLDFLNEDQNSTAANKWEKRLDYADEKRNFDPKEPNILPLEPEDEGEKVDLKHQEINDRKNSEEWMVDYALRQVVTKLRSARRRKVSLLVEAYEEVMPTASFKHCISLQNATQIQACM